MADPVIQRATDIQDFFAKANHRPRPFKSEIILKFDKSVKDNPDHTGSGCAKLHVEDVMGTKINLDAFRADLPSIITEADAFLATMVFKKDGSLFLEPANTP